MRTTAVLAAAVAAVSSLAGAAFADVAFPARLEVTETAPGSYDITFTLPIVEGRKLRAEPSMPPICRDVSEHRVKVSSAAHTTTWTSRCEPASLGGEAILVEGLLGTQTDLALTLETLDGRVFSEILRSSRPGFLVPEPPSVGSLGAQAAVAGMRRTLRHLPLWMLFATAALLGARWRALAAGAATFAGAHAVGQWLGGSGWLALGLPERDLFVLATVAVPAVALAGGGEGWRGWLEPLWPAAGLVGLLYGGAAPQALPPNGLSDIERLLALAFFGGGVALGLLWMAVAATELDRVVRLGEPEWGRLGVRCLGYGLGAAATGLLLAGVVALGLLESGGRGTPLELVLLGAALGPALVGAGRGGAETIPLFAGLAGVGIAAGLMRVTLPLGSTLVVGSLLLLGVTLAASRPLARRAISILAVVATPAAAWLVTEELVESVSRSAGRAVGAAVLASCVLYAGLGWSRARRLGDRASHRRGLVYLGLAIVVAAVAARAGEYRAWLDRQLATEAALGLVRLPVLALLLIAVALLVWPRRRRVLVELGLERRGQMAHWLLLGLAWLALPYGTLAVRNPFFEPHAPRGEDARRVVSRVLSDTYHAFNLTDENELYDRLAESVTGDLIDDLYLDSRRRLTAGTREGAEVTVRDVRVLDIGESDSETRSGSALAYDCRWVVTARVRHLQHVHHRRNVYNGVLALRVDGDRWKIAGIELRSEERRVVPGTPS